MTSTGLQFKRAPVRGPAPPSSLEMLNLTVHIEYPAWVAEIVDWDRAYPTDLDRMELAIAMSRENVERETGGPFGAAIFETQTGRLVAVGMNSVVRLNNCTRHGAMVAF